MYVLRGRHFIYRRDEYENCSEELPDSLLRVCGGLGLPVHSARQWGKWRPTVDANVTPSEQFDLSDPAFSALVWRTASAQSAAA